MTTANLSLACPPMPSYKVSGKLRRTAAEPMTATVTLEDGTIIVVPNVTIPQTDVDRAVLFPPRWTVRACVGESALNRFPHLRVELPAEDCVFEWMAMTMVALPIDAAATFVDVDGSVWKGTVAFPICHVDVLTNPMQAEAVTATGVLELQ